MGSAFFLVLVDICNSKRDKIINKMKTDYKSVNVYVQPACKIVQVLIQQLIATSGLIEKSGENEEVDW